MIIKLIITIFAAMAGGKAARMAGGGAPHWSRWVGRTAAVIPFVASCIPFAGAWGFLAGLGIYGVITGHGQYFLTRLLKGVAPEQMDWVVRIFFGRDWRTRFPEGYIAFDLIQREMYYEDIEGELLYRNLFGMFVTGALIGLPALALAITFGAWPQAILFALTGPIKATVYAIVYRFTADTAPAEWGNGTARTIVALVALWIGV